MTRTVPLMIFKMYSTCPRPPSRAPPWSCPSSAAGSCSRPTQEINQSINQIYILQHTLMLQAKTLMDFVIQAYPNVSTIEERKICLKLKFF